MKICIPFKVKKVGGSSTFVTKFTAHLKKRGVTVTHNPEEYADIFFVMSSRPLTEIWRMKKRGVKIVQRLDGVYYWRVKGIKYPLWNLRMKFIHNHLANLIVYQSQFSQFLCTTFLGKPKAEHKIILNGVDTNLFSLQRKGINLRDNSAQKILFTVSEFRRKDMLLPLLEAVEKLWLTRQDFKFVIAGTLTPELKKSLGRFHAQPYLQWLGEIPNENLAQYENGADVFLFSDSSACPNVVVEALACGLPVVAFKRGAIPELVDQKNGIIIPHQQDEFIHLRPFDTGRLAKAIETVLSDLESYKRNARESALKHFTIEQMIDRYLQAFATLI